MNAFDPMNQSLNFVAGNDDGNAGIGSSDFTTMLTPGVDYFLVTTAFSNGDFGNFTNTITGPGDVLCPPFSCTDGVQNGNETGIDCGGPDCPPCEDSIPTLSEWGLMIFGLIILNMGVFALRRKEEMFA